MRHLTWLLILALATGCSGKKDDKGKTADSAKKSGDDDDHEHGPGPHKGLVEDFKGGKHHFEFVVDHDKKEVRVYILDGKAKNEVPVKADKLTLNIKDPKFTLELKPDTVDANGRTSCFVGKDDRFGKKQEFAGSVTVVVDGTPWTGDFEEKPHHEKK